MATDKNIKSPKAGPNLLCRVANPSPEKVCEYVKMLPKTAMRAYDFRKLMKKSWFSNIHQAPEQWGLYCLTEENYIPKFNRDISLEEARDYLKIWIRKLPLINPYTSFKVSCDLPMVESIEDYLKAHPTEKNLKKIIRELIDYEGPFVLNEIIVNAINNYSGKLETRVIDKDDEQFEVYLRPDYIEEEITMDKTAFFNLFTPASFPKRTSPVSGPLQQIFYGAPGTGKSHEIKKESEQYEHFRITFHPDTDYAAFVGAYKPVTKDVPVRDINGRAVELMDESGKLAPVMEQKITYEFGKQAFLNAYVAAWKEQQKPDPQPVFLIIEEINRGNCAQIFGDIFQLLDRNEADFSDYPIHADSDLAKHLKAEFKDLNIAEAQKINSMYGGKDIAGAVKSGDQLLLPDNLYIWATMNTSDQSLFPIDSAFKRRWDWKYIKISDSGKNYLISANGNEYDWWEFIQKINHHIGTTTDQEDKKLGYFFVKAAENAEGKRVISAARFLSKVLFFLYGDVYKDYGFDDAIFKGEEGKPMEFSDYFDEAGSPDEAKVERFIQNVLASGENS